MKKLPQPIGYRKCGCLRVVIFRREIRNNRGTHKGWSTTQTCLEISHAVIDHDVVAETVQADNPWMRDGKTPTPIADDVRVEVQKAGDIFLNVPKFGAVKEAIYEAFEDMLAIERQNHGVVVTGHPFQFAHHPKPGAPQCP